MPSRSESHALERYAWMGGILYVAALVTESAISLAAKISQNDSATKIANSLADHHKRTILVACICILYAVGFTVYLTRLRELLRRASEEQRFFGSWVLIGGVLFVTLHSVSDIGIYGILGAKVATYSAQSDPGLAYTLYLLTFALDSVGDVFGSLFMLGTGLLVLTSRALPRWLGWVAVLASPFLLLQGFGLGGVISSFGLTLDLIGFLLLLVFVLASSIIGLTRKNAPASTSQ
jgi:Domain of unknown function (DUF4386)